MCFPITLFLLCCSVYCPEIPLALLVYYEISVAQHFICTEVYAPVREVSDSNKKKSAPGQFFLGCCFTAKPIPTTS